MIKRAFILCSLNEMSIWFHVNSTLACKYNDSFFGTRRKKKERKYLNCTAANTVYIPFRSAIRNAL